ncbi:MAG TPA: hypothetical protein VFL90_13705 [Methylomirabilota bacterium]|nr:hypothetical protein [Methylomirabilota bacterium]
MRLARIWPLLALSVLALPVPAAADARDYPSHVPATHSGHAGRGGHFDGRFGHRRSAVFVLPAPLYVTPYDAPAYAPPPVYAPPMYAPPVSYAPPPPPAYAPPATAYAPPPPPAPTAPPAPRVVEFGSGRYELRGDGVDSPYVWVWVPNPPSAPPGPPAPPPTVYRWTDDKGVTTWTDDLQKVPPRYRAQAAQRSP